MPIRRDFTFTSAAGRRLRAFYAEPESAGESAGEASDGGHAAATLPAVIVVHEIMGLNDDVRRIATRFADRGYVALAPDLVGSGFQPLCIARFVRGIGQVGDGRPYREMAAFQDWLAARPAVDKDRIGMAGFCIGGGFAILYAARGGRDLRAVAPFYGAMPADDSIIPALCPVVASYGGRDLTLGKTGPKLAAALDAAGIPNDVKTYPGAGHSFMSHHDGLAARLAPVLPTRMGFDPEASEDAWGRVVAFFGEHLAPRGAGEPA
jgi:carboxymethylenebutenolidase